MNNYTNSGVKLVGDELQGYCVVFYDPSNPDTEYHITDNFVERVDPTCEINTDDNMRCVMNHDEGTGYSLNAHLGSLKAGTLTITRDKKGLAYTAKLNQSTASRDAREMAGEFQGSSFKYRPELSQFKMTREGNKLVRTFTKLHLEHCSPVLDPAYPAATRSIRSASSGETESFTTFLDTEARLRKADSYIP